MSAKKRKRFTSEQKAEMLRKHLADKVPVSKICEEYGVQPSLFYLWQKEMMTRLTLVFEPKSETKQQRHAEAKAEQKIAVLEAKIARKDAVLGELMEEHIKLKKSLGEI